MSPSPQGADAEMRGQRSPSPRRDKDTVRPTSSRSPPPHRSPSRSRSPLPPPRRSRSPSDASLHSLSGSRSRSPSRSLSRSPPPRSIASQRSRDASFSPVAARGSRRDRHAAGPCVKVTGLTKMVTRSHVEEIFGYYGQVKSCTLPLFTRSQESKGNAWVLFTSTSSAEKAIEHMDKGQIDGAVVSVDFGRFPQPEPHRDPRDDRYRRNSRDGDRNGRASRENGAARGDRYWPSTSQYPSREDHDGRYPPPHLARDQGNGYGRRSASPGSRRRSRSPPPRKLGRKRSLSRSLSRDGGRGTPARRRDDSMSRSPSRSRSRSRSYSRSPSYSPPPRRRRSSSREYSRDSRNPRRSRSRSRSFTPKRGDRNIGGPQSRSRSRLRSRSRSRSESLDRNASDARRDRMSLSPANPEGRP